MNISHTESQQAPMTIALIMHNETDNTINTIAQTIKKDLQFTGQFIITLKKIDTQLPKKETMQQLSSAGISLAISLISDSPDTLKWRLYDTFDQKIIIKQISKKNNNIARGWAHAIADELWKKITNNDGFFSSRITYCKDLKNEDARTIRKIYIADFDGSNEELLVDLPTISIAPRWHITKPRIFYSEYADTNVRLVSISMEQKRKIVSSFDGINMLATFSEDGKTVAYCSSRGDGSCQLYYCKKGTLKRFTKNSGNNVSPLFIDDTRICFCSDFQTGSPQIYIGNIETGHLQRITKGGYCTSPSYCKKTNTLAYHMMVNGIMQLFTYDFAAKEHTQRTKTAGNKHEASWSPCGTQLLFSQENGTSSKLIILNLLTNKTYSITGANQQYSYPHWGPCYTKFPVIT